MIRLDLFTSSLCFTSQKHILAPSYQSPLFAIKLEGETGHGWKGRREENYSREVNVPAKRG